MILPYIADRSEITLAVVDTLADFVNRWLIFAIEHFSPVILLNPENTMEDSTDACKNQKTEPLYEPSLAHLCVDMQNFWVVIPWTQQLIQFYYNNLLSSEILEPFLVTTNRWLEKGKHSISTLSQSVFLCCYKTLTKINLGKKNV